MRNVSLTSNGRGLIIFSFISLLITSLFIGLSSSCKNEDSFAAPKIDSVNYITSNSCILYGNIGDGIAITYGLVYADHPEPTINDSTVRLLAGDFKALTGYIPNLKPGTTYHFRLYVSDWREYNYSEPMKVRTLDATTFTDHRDGQVYETVKIGNQTWMAENLNYYVPNSVYYKNDSMKYHTNGRLYSWEEAQMACPSGWHVPTDVEWKELERLLGMPEEMIHSDNRPINTYAYPLLSLDYVFNHNENTTNQFGFTLKPTGAQNIQQLEFIDIYGSFYFWTSTSISHENKSFYIYRNISHKGRLSRIESNFAKRLAVRCVKDK